MLEWIYLNGNQLSETGESKAHNDVCCAWLKIFKTYWGVHIPNLLMFARSALISLLPEV